MTKPIATRPTPWTRILLLCGKCARKMDGGYGPDRTQTLKTASRSELRQQGHGRRTRILETRCLGLCPKKAVAALSPEQPGRLLAIPKGTTPADALLALQTPQSAA